MFYNNYKFIKLNINWNVNLKKIGFELSINSCLLSSIDWIILNSIFLYIGTTLQDNLLDEQCDSTTFVYLNNFYFELTEQFLVQNKVWCHRKISIFLSDWYNEQSRSQQILNHHLNPEIHFVCSFNVIMHEVTIIKIVNRFW